MTNIRQRMEEALKEEFHELVLKIHGTEGLTQTKNGERTFDGSPILG